MSIPQYIHRRRVRVSERLGYAWLFIVAAAWCSGKPLLAEDTGTLQDERHTTRLLEIYQQDAAEYVITLNGNGGIRLELQPEPVFIWTNPTRHGGQHGAVYVWTHDGRPEVIGTIFSGSRSGGQYGLNHEFHSLAAVPLTAERPAGQLQWAPAEAGLDFQPIPGAPLPAGSAVQRFVQLRGLARQFTAESLDRRGRWDLRLLPQPVYRYDSARAGVEDGAVFLFVTTAGTDPEVILVIESHQADAGHGSTGWHYGLGRFSDLKLFVSHNGTEVWSFEHGDRGAQFQAGPRDPYRFIHDRVIQLEDEGGQ